MYQRNQPLPVHKHWSLDSFRGKNTYNFLLCLFLKMIITKQKHRGREGKCMSSASTSASTSMSLWTLYFKPWKHLRHRCTTLFLLMASCWGRKDDRTQCPYPLLPFLLQTSPPALGSCHLPMPFHGKQAEGLYHNRSCRPDNSTLKEQSSLMSSALK